MTARTYTVPFEGGITKTLAYVPMVMTIGGKRCRFAIQGDIVAHYASGMRIGNLNPVKIEMMCRWSHHTRTSNRQAAAIVINRIIDRIGVDTFLAKLAAAPILNH